MKTCRTYERNGFLISRTGGADAPWRCWHPDGRRFRADTLRGAFAMVRRDH